MPYNSKRCSRYETLYSSLLPLLLVIVLILAGSSVALLKKSQNGDVLSKGSDSDGSSSGSDNDSDDDSDDSENDDSESDDDENDDQNDDNGIDDNDDQDEDDNSRSGSGSGSNTTNRNSGESKTRETVINSDGTTSEIRREVKDDGEVKIEVRTFDADGNKISVQKSESKEGEEKSRLKVYDASGAELSDTRFETKDGKRIEFRTKEGDNELSRIRIDLEKNELIVKSEEDDENEASSESRLRIRVSGNSFLIRHQGVNALSKFPLTVDDVTGKILVKTPSGDVELKAMPETIVAKAQASDDVDEVGDVSLDSSISETKNLEYVVTGTKAERLFGFFTIRIPANLIYDAQTGTFLRNDQTFVTKIFDLFSF